MPEPFVPPSASMKGKVALVTGGGRSIGKAIALGLASCGAAVAIAEIDRSLCDEAVAEVRKAGGKALGVVTDVRDLAQVERAVAKTIEAFGGLDFLVNNAGGNVGREDLLDTGPDKWDAALKLNLMSVIYGVSAAAPKMIERGGGSIINVATIEAFRAAPGYAVYAAAKAGVISLTQTLALELGPKGVRVNAIAPDVTPGPRIQMGGTSDALARTGASMPLGRVGRPEDYAGTAIYLASDLSAWVTGCTIHVDGGTHAASGWVRFPDGQYRVYRP